MATKKRDARKLDHKTLEAIRIRAVEQVQAGESPAVVIQALGFSRACIYEWLAWYREGGWEALRAAPSAVPALLRTTSSATLLSRVLFHVGPYCQDPKRKATVALYRLP